MLWRGEALVALRQEHVHRSREREAERDLVMRPPPFQYPAIP